MKVERGQLSPEEVLQRAEHWYRRQLELLERCHGSQWPKHREWIQSYLRAELRERLIAEGWRPKA